MLISKFNKLIHNKFLWGLFAVLISVAFVFTFGAGSRGCDDEAAPRSGIGKLGDAEISAQEFRIARFFELGMRRNINLPAEAEAMLRERVWQRLAALAQARELGLEVSDQEVAAVIQQDQAFQDNGRFSRERYRAVVRRQLEIDVITFEEYMRQELLLRKLQEMSMAFTWPSPYEVEQSLADMTDRRHVQYATFPRAELTPDVTVSTNDVRAYYDEQEALFEEPERVAVRYVAYSLSNYMDEVSIPETNVVTYYNEHIEDYATTGTNGEEIVTELNQVRTSIHTQLQHEAALDLAMRDATEFVVSLVPGRYADAVPFDEAVGQAGLVIHTTAMFSITADVPGLDVGEEFRRAAFNLEADDPDLRFSDAIPGGKAVYVVSAWRQRDAHIPPFEEVADTVYPLALSNAMEEAFSERIDSLHQRIEAAVTAGEPFAEAIDVPAANVATTGVFSVYEGLREDAPYSETLPRAVMALRAGELSDPVPVDLGYLIAYVAGRSPGDMTEATMLRPQLASSLRQYRAGMIYRAWSENMLGDDFEDYAAAAYEDLEEDGTNGVEGATTDAPATNATAGD